MEDPPGLFFHQSTQGLAKVFGEGRGASLIIYHSQLVLLARQPEDGIYEILSMLSVKPCGSDDQIIFQDFWM